jgi:hypothetical protein
VASDVWVIKDVVQQQFKMDDCRVKQSVEVSLLLDLVVHLFKTDGGSNLVLLLNKEMAFLRNARSPHEDGKVNW